MALLTYRKRQRLRRSEFAIPSERKYPIEDIAHGRDALARVSRFGTPYQKRKVREAVHRRYPSIHIHVYSEKTGKCLYCGERFRME